MILTQISHRQTKQLVHSLRKWPDIELALLLSEMISCLPAESTGLVEFSLLHLSQSLAESSPRSNRNKVHVRLAASYLLSSSDKELEQAASFIIFMDRDSCRDSPESCKAAHIRRDYRDDLRDVFISKSLWNSCYFLLTVLSDQHEGFLRCEAQRAHLKMGHAFPVFEGSRLRSTVRTESVKPWRFFLALIPRTQKVAFFNYSPRSEHPVFGKSLRESLRKAAVQISTASPKGDLYVCGSVPIVLAKW